MAMMKYPVLVVEDNRHLLELISRALEKEFEVFLCETGEEAFEFIESIEFFSVIVDLNLPGINGHELIAEIKSKSTIQSPFLIMISARDDFNSKLMAVSLGAISFIEKPFDIRYLRGVLTNLRNHLEENQISTTGYGEIGFNPILNQYSLNGTKLVLTEAERKILEELIRNQEEEVARERLFLIAGNHKDETNYRVVDSHISSLRRKIKNSDLEIKSIYGKGYKIKKAS